MGVAPLALVCVELYRVSGIALAMRWTGHDRAKRG